MGASGRQAAPLRSRDLFCLAAAGVAGGATGAGLLSRGCGGLALVGPLALLLGPFGGLSQGDWGGPAVAGGVLFLLRFLRFCWRSLLCL